MSVLPESTGVVIVVLQFAGPLACDMTFILEMRQWQLLGLRRDRKCSHCEAMQSVGGYELVLVAGPEIPRSHPVD